MPDLNFSQPERTNPLKNILIAAVVLAVVAALVFYFNPRDTATLSLSNTNVVGTRTHFKSDSIVVSQTPAGQDDLYILTTLQVDDHLRLPIQINTITATITSKDDAQSTTSAINVTDLPAVFGAFQQLKPLAAPPLLRETVVNPGNSASGQLVFHFPFSKAMYDDRKSAVITLELYHQKPISITIP
ncbi:hypothetical protein [Granulicella pectinivorans]|jgi:hypothetical protein|nr:hypothetical protein [Granulicella pectinivorans]